MKYLCSILLLVFSVFTQAHGQRKGLTQEDIKTLAGSWSGSLIYTDYADDKKQVTLPASLIVKDSGDSLNLSFAYTEPGGSIITESSMMQLIMAGDILILDKEEYFVAAVRRVGIRLTIIVERDGTDNNKEALIRQTIIIGPDILNITKEIKYEGKARFFTRNKMEFKKKQ